MQRTMLKSKLHRATVTEANLEYEGSITIDRELMKAANIWPYEQVDVYNVTNGARFTTYAIEGQAGSGVICINGAAAHHAREGHLVIICTYVRMEEKDIPGFEPKCILLGPGNKPKGKAL